jgi:hypothetical protein
VAITKALLLREAKIDALLGSPETWPPEITGASSDTRSTKSEQGGTTTPTARSI